MLKSARTLTLLSRSIAAVCVVIWLLMPVLLLKARAQEGEPAPKASASAGASAVVVSGEDYRLAAGDVINIQIEKAPELSGTFRLSANGSILLPYLGRTMAQGKTIEELSNQIENGLRGRYLVNPRAAITVTQYNSRTFFVQGAVKNPGAFQIEGKPSIVKLISIAGGLLGTHGSTVFIIREIKQQDKDKAALPNGNAQTDKQPQSTAAKTAQPDASDAAESGKYELLSVNINRLFNGGFDQNLIVEPGDIVNIPQADVFFVAGEVRAPGSFPLKDGTTLRQAISLAQGLTFEASKDNGIIFREETGGARAEVKVDIGAIMSGKREDVALKANDVIIVPNSRFKSVSGALLRAFGVNAARVPYRY